MLSEGGFRNGLRLRLAEHLFTLGMRGARSPSMEDICHEMRCQKDSVPGLLDDLQASGDLVIERDNPQLRFVLPKKGVVLGWRNARGPATGETVKRACLCCGKNFKSQHKGNRMCDDCR